MKALYTGTAKYGTLNSKYRGSYIANPSCPNNLHDSRNAFMLDVSNPYIPLPCPAMHQGVEAWVSTVGDLNNYRYYISGLLLKVWYCVPQIDIKIVVVVALKQHYSAYVFGGSGVAFRTGLGIE